MKPKIILCLALLLGGLALCGAGLWLLLSPPQYAATMRIRVEQYDEVGGVSYNPYFIQTEFEIMQSQLVLSNVVADLNLNVIWGKRHYSGEPLKYAECYEIIKKHMRLTPVRNLKMVDITYYSSDPKEAADVANAIGVGYREYRIQSLKNQIARSLEVLQQQYQDEEKQISTLQIKVEQLRQNYVIQDRVSNTRSLEQQPYWEAKKQLDRLTDLHKLLALKIEAEKIDAKIQKTYMAQIIDRAEPLQFPVGSNHPLGAALLALGLFPLLGGILLLKSKQ